MVKVDFGKGMHFISGAFIGAVLIFISYPFLFQTTPECAYLLEPVFSPGAESEVLSLINSAEETIDLEMYVFTSEEVRSALADAEGRGVEVRAILEPRLFDKSRQQETYDYLKGNGAEVRWASLSYKLTHSKMMIIDGEKALIGSINFSWSALNKNREAGAVIYGEPVKEYLQIFESDWSMGT